MVPRVNLRSWRECSNRMLLERCLTLITRPFRYSSLNRAQRSPWEMRVEWVEQYSIVPFGKKEHFHAMEKSQVVFTFGMSSRPKSNGLHFIVRMVARRKLGWSGLRWISSFHWVSSSSVNVDDSKWGGSSYKSFICSEPCRRASIINGDTHLCNTITYPETSHQLD